MKLYLLIILHIDYSLSDRT